MIISLLYLSMDFQTMRKREYQSFTLKLTDLKEYELAQKERAESKMNAAAVKHSDGISSKFGPKSASEIRERIGLKSKSRSMDGV